MVKNLVLEKVRQLLLSTVICVWQMARLLQIQLPKTGLAKKKMVGKFKFLKIEIVDGKYLIITRVLLLF